MRACVCAYVHAHVCVCVCAQTVEAALFLFASLGECREVEDSGYLPQVMHLLPAIQRLNDVAMSTALSFIGRSYIWFTHTHARTQRTQNSHPKW